ncbi:twin-arginine translocation signal domain-containing protein [Zoogloea sp.]
MSTQHQQKTPLRRGFLSESALAGAGALTAASGWPSCA